MTQNGCTTFSGSGVMNTLCKPVVPRSSIVACLSHRPNKTVLFTPIRSSWTPHQSFRSQFHDVSHPLHMSASSNPLHHSQSNLLLPLIRQRGKPSTAPRAASNDAPSDYRYPPMTEKPRWYWRFLACITYVMPLHEPWMFAETAYSLSVFLERYEFLTYRFFRVIGSFPRGALLIYFLTAYLGVVRRKEWPHFLRHHVVMGMLLEITIQVTGFASRWVPRSFRYGQLGMYFWNIMALGFLFTVVECIRCALTGVYADVPFISDAGYIQIPYG